MLLSQLGFSGVFFNLFVFLFSVGGSFNYFFLVYGCLDGFQFVFLGYLEMLDSVGYFREEKDREGQRG